MKIFIGISLFLLSAFALFASPDRSAVLRAINEVENPTNSSAPGRCGELGPYQFTARTWHVHTRLPFAFAVQRGYADDVAVKHYEWIRRGLVQAGVFPSPFNIALAWNSGLTAAVSGKSPVSSYEYARRVVNLVR